MNYNLRSNFLKPGEPQIEFVFKPSSFKIRSIIRLIAFISISMVFFYHSATLKTLGGLTINLNWDVTIHRRESSGRWEA